MRRNGGLENQVGKVQSRDSLPASTTEDPNPSAEICFGGPVSSQDTSVSAEIDSGSRLHG